MCSTWYSVKSRMTLKHISFCFPPLTGLNMKHPELLSGYTNRCSIRFKPLHSHHYRPLGWNESASFFFSTCFPSFVSLYATRISCCGIEVSWLASSRCQVVTEWNSYVMRVFRGTEGLKTTKNGHFISCELGFCSKRSPRDQTLNHFGVFKKGRNFFVLTHAKFQLFKEFAVHKERCKVTPGPPLQVKILSFTYN